MNARSLTSIKLLQVSDCHISASREVRYRGLDADRSLFGLLPAIRAWRPDAILLTGDVAEDASATAYGRVSAMLCSAGAPVHALPGNHDEPAVMQHSFRSGPWAGPRFVPLKNWQLVLLDSTSPGEIGGEIGERELDQLEAGLQRSQAEHVILALHHQPVPVGSPWIDKYALTEPRGFLDLVEQDKRVRCITWGHVHQDIEMELDGIRMLGAPSSVANSLPGRDKFTLDTTGPACRWLRLLPDGNVETGLLRAGASGESKETKRLS